MATTKRVRLVLCAEITTDGKLLDGSPRGTGSDAEARAREFFYAGATAVLHCGDPSRQLSMARSADHVWVHQIRKPGDRGETVAAWRRDVRALLHSWLGDERPGNALCFGGPVLFRTLLENGLADELRLLVHPQIDGRRDAPTLSGPAGAAFFPASVACRLLSAETYRDCCFLHYRVLRRRVARA